MTMRSMASGFGGICNAALVLMGCSLGTAALAASPDVVISQVYGGGGNSGATYKNDFIELYNRGSTAVSLTGWSVQYSAAGASTWTGITTLSGTIGPGAYYLVQEAAGSGGTTNLPTPDATGTIALSATAGKVALVTSTATLTCGASCAGTTSVKDFVGFGSANNYEGSGPTPAPSNTTAVLRAGNGATDTDNNATDFTAGAPNPRNSGSAGVVNGACGSSNGNTFASAPTVNLCSAGNASTVSGSGPWTWTCTGTGGGTPASCSANLSTASPFTIFHTNDVHARLTPHKWVIPKHGSDPDVFEDVGGAAHLAGEMVSLVTGKPTALVLDAGDISEGNPVGDMNVSCSQGTGGAWTCTLAQGQTAGTGYGNGGMTAFYELLHSKLKNVSGRGGARGIDALVVGNHDVRDVSYIANMEHMASAGVPVISANVRDLNCTQAHPRYATGCEHFPATTTVTVNGTKVGIIGYTTSSAQVGASLASTLTVVDCQWTGSSTCNIAPYVNDLRNNQGAQVVILLTHDGHSDLVDYATPVLADTVDAKVPEIAITGHWHTWSDTVWQPDSLNYKTVFAESSSYMKYIGELNVDGTGGYQSATQHVLRNADITPDPDVLSMVQSLKDLYQTATGQAVDATVGYTSDDLLLDNRMKWWSADEYPWSGNNTAGQWITDAMKWKCDQIWAGSGGCDLAIEAGGGVRSDIPKGAVTLLHVYETFPWADDTYVRITLTGQQIIDFIQATNLDTGFSSALDVTAFDGIPTLVKMNGQPIGLTTNYKVAINNYMLAHPPSGYTWPTTINAESDPAATLVRSSLIEFMQQVHGSPATAYSVGGDRYHFNGEYSGGYRAVVTMMDDNEYYQGKRRRTFDKAFIRLLSATPETLARRGSKQVPASLVNADGSVDAANRLSEQELFRSFLGFKTGALKAGDIIEVYGKASFYGGNPEFVDQEGIYGNGVEFKILGNDASLAKATYVSSINGFLTDDFKNHYVKFRAKKSATDSVTDQYGTILKIWDKTGYTAASLPGNIGDTLEISGVPTMENFALRFRSDSAAVTTASLTPGSTVVSRVGAQPASTSSASITLMATAAIASGIYSLSPSADVQVASGNAGTNYGTATNFYVESSTAGAFGIERGWLKFDLSGIPAGSTITGATLKLWNWKSTGPALPVEVRGIGTDGWTETGITWANQPAASGASLDTQTLASGTTNVWYAWDVGSFVQAEFAGDKQVSLLVKAADEAAAGGPSYSFDTKEYGSNAPVLQVSTQVSVSSVAGLRYYYRYSSDNATWGAWTQIGTTPVTAAPYTLPFSFPSGYGYYEFYSIATDNLGGVEPAPAYAQASVRYQVATGQTQTITFAQPSPVQVGSGFSLSATASSGLPVTFSSTSTGVCTVSGNVVSTIAVGTCTVAANQAGDAGYLLPASVSQSFAVTLISQTITFSQPADLSLSAGSTSASATASSGLPVSFSSLTTNVCTVNGNTVQLLVAGTCTLVASQAGNANYDAAPSEQRSFSVTGAVAGNPVQVPLPSWALVLMAAGLLGVARVNLRARLHRLARVKER